MFFMAHMENGNVYQTVVQVGIYNGDVNVVRIATVENRRIVSIL